MRKLEPNDIIPIREYIMCLSQRQFARLIGVSQATVFKWEHGQLKKLSPKHLDKLEQSVFRVVERETLFKLIDQYHTDKKGEIM